ncbi:hypothetical protein ACIQ8D_30505 [Streptomyces sp. NPDC096094]|uniref:hypothetical protein n=1 Tax=Streptomyces sp. NPDC096094 TaxID=3366073 RepID=UPI00380B3D86
MVIPGKNGHMALAVQVRSSGNAPSAGALLRAQAWWEACRSLGTEGVEFVKQVDSAGPGDRVENQAQFLLRSRP